MTLVLDSEWWRKDNNRTLINQVFSEVVQLEQQLLNNNIKTSNWTINLITSLATLVVTKLENRNKEVHIRPFQVADLAQPLRDLLVQELS